MHSPENTWNPSAPIDGVISGPKLIIQIPCLNEEASLPFCLADLPENIPGVQQIEILIIDDGSTDNTAEVALEHKVDHLIRFKQHRGLARAFDTGLRHALDLGADIIVNTDADNQYAARCIPDLLRPILEGRADLVIGTRPIETIPDFSWMKKKLQTTGSWMVRQISGTRVLDAASGFRAFNRRAASCMRIASDYTYTIESILLASRHGLRIAQVPIEVNPPLRESRLSKGTLDYLMRTSGSLIRTFLS